MNWKRWAGLVTIFVLGFGAYGSGSFPKRFSCHLREDSSVRAVSAAQDEGALSTRKPAMMQPTNR